MIKYLGSKRTLLPSILSVVQGLGPDVHTVIDLFSGTSRVGHALKAAGYQVFSNDLLSFAHALATCYVAADSEQVSVDAQLLIDEFNRLPGSPGYFTDTFCERARFLQPRNGARVDAIREAIEAKALPTELRAVLLVSLMEAADRVDSTAGLQMAYLKAWAPRAHKELELRLPRVLPRARLGKGRALQLEAAAAAGELEADLAYLDPPYNHHSYLGNYHVWESLVRWDKPEVYGVACKRVDVRERSSTFNSKRTFLPAFEATLDALRVRHLIVSFSDEGFVDRAGMEAVLSRRGALHTLEYDYKRYVGAQIGIHSPQGERVGRVSHLRNREYLYVVSPFGQG